MAKLSWGKPTIEHGTSAAGAVASSFTAITLDIVEKSSELTVTEGEVLEAKDEGGDVVDSRTGKNAYVFAFEVYVKKGDTLPFTDNDGVISGEHSIRLTGEDNATPGFLMPVCRISAQTTWKSDIGKKVKYICRGLKPASGNILQEYSVPPANSTT